MSQANSGILVVGLVQRGKLASSAYELLTAGRALADTLKEPLVAVVLGAKPADYAKDLIERGADKAFVIEHPSLENFNDELHTKAVAELVEKEKFGKVLIAASVAGKSLAGRLAVRLRAGLAADASEVYQNGTGLKARRMQFSGNIISEVQFASAVQIATVQPMTYPRSERQPGRSGETVAVAFDPGPARIEFVSFQAEETSEVDLGAAERIVSGGRGLGNADGFKIVRDLAHAIGAAIGASRAVVDSGWIPYRHQVGLTGRTVRPKLYVACGISGQIQHLAGMSSSGTIVAINTDPECPMMQLASVAVVGDVNELLPLITAEIKARRGTAAAA
ncbi:MAG: electron transfer flavoprotein subunit alpha/FixB family protein [Elusimicrobia bacterium]|nr:electron transfer flavoprotein subunit alpha/FixB family protein [Elusimicrobiota bacterium]